MGRAGCVQQTKDEEPVTKSSQQKNKKQQTAIRGPVRFLLPETLRRQPRLRRSGLGTASNEVREFRFRGASPSQASTTESSQDYNTQGAPRRLGGRSRSSKSSEEVNAKLNKSAGAFEQYPASERRTTFPSGHRARGPFPLAWASRVATGASAAFQMSSKESCGKKEKSQRRGTTPSPSVDEEVRILDNKEKKTSANFTSSACSVIPVSTEKRKLVSKSDHTHILYCNIKRRQELKRLNVETDTPRKRPKLSSSSQGLVKLQETSYSNDNQIISQSPSSNGTKKGISKCIDFKVKDIKLTNVKSELDHGIKNFSSPKIAKDVRPKAEGQASEKKWPHLLAQREKMKELKKERYKKFRDSSEKYVLEKCKRIQFSQDYKSNKIIKEPLESRRKKINFKILGESRETLQKLVEENVFSLDSNKLKTKQEKKECLEGSQVSLNLTRHKSEHLFSDSTYKQTVREWEGKYHEHQRSNDSSSSEILTQKLLGQRNGDIFDCHGWERSFEAPCSSVSLESIQDTDQEMQIVEELHAARMGKSVDLPVVPPSGELTSMEIDLVEDDVHSSSGISYIHMTVL
ncbi:hypothetical protein J1605_018802 [Eschrichtius robustus]|uniref:Uncharacterized protein n=1 Tax=Eschrichtius robustus TaxID=9764 RepID=A0AB34HWI9_ESCRO|nr:hypothetical protein J1605_018802 [Eschrichtius robustus]